MGIIAFIILGLLAGAIAKLLLPGDDPGGFIVTTLLGIIGAFVATYLGQAIGWYRADEGAGFIGAVVGAGAATVIFFLAPFAGLLVALYAFFMRKKRELPYGPYLSLASAAALLFYCPIAEYLSPGIQGMGEALRQLFGH